MSRRYPEGMRLRLSFALFSVLLMIVADDAAAQVRATASASASARIVERPVRIVAADLRRAPTQLPGQAQITTRPCDAPAPPGCRLLVVELP
jgi:hypothetical protein